MINHDFQIPIERGIYLFLEFGFRVEMISPLVNTGIFVYSEQQAKLLWNYYNSCYLLH